MTVLRATWAQPGHVTSRWRRGDDDSKQSCVTAATLYLTHMI